MSKPIIVKVALALCGSLVLLALTWKLFVSNPRAELREVSRTAFITYIRSGGDPYKPVPVRGIGGDDMILVSAANGWSNVLHEVAKAGYSLNYTNDVGDTPLLAAAGGSRNVGTVKLLIASGNDVNARSRQGGTPLVLCAFRKDAASVEIANELIRSGADVNAMTPNGITPLTRAFQTGQAEMIGLLLRSGADIHVLDPQSRKPLLEEVDRLSHDARLVVSNLLHQ